MRMDDARLPDRLIDEMFPVDLDNGATLTYDSAQEIIRLLNHPVRSRHTCISKGQLHEVIDQLIAHNVFLQEQIKQLSGAK